MEKMDVSEVITNLDRVLDRVHDGERIIVVEHEKEMIALVSLKDLEFLERLEHLTELENDSAT